MRKSKLWREEYISQIPALLQLQQMGYEYLNPDQALNLRDHKYNRVILEPILSEQLHKINAISYKGKEHRFSDSNIQNAVRELRDIPLTGGLVSASEKAYDLLTLGKSYEQNIDGDKKSFSLRYIDWENPENNVFHVTDEFEVEKTKSHDLRRPDIVIFVNGIPLVVIEAKRPDTGGGESSVWEAVSQIIRNQRKSEIPNLFIFSQLVIGINKNEVQYGTTNTPKKFWALWREEIDNEKQVAKIINAKASEEQWTQVFDHREDRVKRHFEEQRAAGDRLPTEQDKGLYSLLEKNRLLELIYRFVLYDAGTKKITRYQQYFAIRATVDRVKKVGKDGSRNGGVIWHTTGSGKSLTMVMLAKSLALEKSISNPKVILVTDRIDLDTQIFGTFQACGTKPIRARSGSHLAEMVSKKDDAIITTVIDKFEAVAREKRAVDNSPNIFILVDESHRSQYGSMNAKMQKVFPNACYIGFTGTPLLKAEKSTSKKFGGIIHKYSINQAVKDKTVVPLLYEGRMAILDVNKQAIDQWFSRVTQGLSKEQKSDLKKKFSRSGEIQQAEGRIQQIAYDISDHYTRNFKGNQQKAQLACPSKLAALAYKKYFDEFGLINAEIVISAPDTREGNEDTDENNLPEIQQFWNRMMTQYGNEYEYNKELVAKFKTEEPPDLLIVVDKLLTGFDAPRNTVLYIDKSLKEHSLLQAIARVNRLFENKDYGYIVDYKGILGQLDDALTTYAALEGYDEEDIEGTVTGIQEAIEMLPQHHSNLVSFFDPVQNRTDTEALERYLEDEALRQEFYELLSAYTKSLKVALSNSDYLLNTPERKQQEYKDHLKHYHNLRASVMRRYAEVVDYSEYESRIKALINRHISSADVEQLNEPVSIFDKEEFDKELDKVKSKTAKADTIASRTKKAITENWDKDPAFYKKFSELIAKTIEDFKQKRISEIEYLEEIMKIQDQVRNKDRSDLPEKLHHNENASAYFGVIGESMAGVIDDENSEIAVEAALKIDAIIDQHKIVNWVDNQNVHNKMMNEIEDYLFSIKGRHNLEISTDVIDAILETVMDVARKRDV